MPTDPEAPRSPDGPWGAAACYYTTEEFRNAWVEPDVAGELATLQTNIENHVAQSSLQFVTGQLDIDDDTAWNAYLDGLRNLGLDRYLQIQQTGYEAAG